MKKGTKITHKSYPFNSDGDHDIKWDKTETVNEEEFNTIFDGPENFFMHIHEGNIYGVNKLIFRGKRFTLLEPNPVTFYFSAAYDIATSYNDIYQIMLELDLTKIMNTVKSFINFYHPKLIVNYNYGK